MVRQSGCACARASRCPGGRARADSTVAQVIARLHAVDCYRAAHPCARDAPGFTRKQHGSCARLDYLLAAPRFTAAPVSAQVEAEVGDWGALVPELAADLPAAVARGGALSDHAPLSVWLEAGAPLLLPLPPPVQAPDTRPRLRTRHTPAAVRERCAAAVNAAVAAMEEHIASTCAAAVAAGVADDTRAELDRAVALLNTTVYEAARRVLGTVSRAHRRPCRPLSLSLASQRRRRVVALRNAVRRLSDRPDAPALDDDVT
jgi:hypothetical protein